MGVMLGSSISPFLGDNDCAITAFVKSSMAGYVINILIVIFSYAQRHGSGDPTPCGGYPGTACSDFGIFVDASITSFSKANALNWVFEKYFPDSIRALWTALYSPSFVHSDNCWSEFDVESQNIWFHPSSTERRESNNKRGIMANTIRNTFLRGSEASMNRRAIMKYGIRIFILSLSEQFY